MSRIRLSGHFIASRWWERLVVAAAWLARRPVVRQGVPPVSRRWTAPPEERPGERS